jgi:hypothetical protein
MIPSDRTLKAFAGQVAGRYLMLLSGKTSSRAPWWRSDRGAGKVASHLL